MQPLRRLLEPEVLGDSISEVRGVLSARTGIASSELEPRAVASLLSLSLFARLVSPVLACAAAGSAVVLTSDNVGWVLDGGRLQLGLVGDVGYGALEDLVPLLEAVIDAFDVSPTVLWGNAASALAAAARIIGPAAQPLVADLLTRGPLAGTGRWTPAFRRNSCCLYYKIPGGGYCGDCVLAQGRF